MGTVLKELTVWWGRESLGLRGFKVSLPGFCGTWVASPSLSSLDEIQMGITTSGYLPLLCHCFQTWAPTLVCSLGFSLLFCKMSETPFQLHQTYPHWYVMGI